MASPIFAAGMVSTGYSSDGTDITLYFSDLGTYQNGDTPGSSLCQTNNVPNECADYQGSILFDNKRTIPVYSGGDFPYICVGDQYTNDCSFVPIDQDTLHGTPTECVGTCDTSSTSEIQIVASPSTSNASVGTPFNIDVKIIDGDTPFNAARATVAVSSNLSITGVHNPTSNACNLQYTQAPTISNQSFAGAIFGGSSTGCTVYTLTLTPISAGTGTVNFTNGSVKAFSNSSEILTSVQNGSFTISEASPTDTPPGTTLVSIDDSVQGSSQNQWNYNGGWSHCTDSGNPACNPSSIYNTSVSWDNTTNDYATVAFTGTRISLYGLVDPNHGTGAVSIDGGSESTVDFQAAARTGNVLLWTSPILAPGQHMFKLRVTNGYVAPDRVTILQTTESGLTVTNDSFATYGPTFTLLGTKDSSITSIFVNDSSSNSSYTSSTWQSVQSVVLGNNSFVIYGKDSNNVQTASISVTVNRHTLGDINGDGVVNLTDASLFAVDWDKTSNLTYNLSDMNGDGNVDLSDLSILAKLEQ